MYKKYIGGITGIYINLYNYISCSHNINVYNVYNIYNIYNIYNLYNIYNTCILINNTLCDADMQQPDESKHSLGIPF